MAKISNAHRKAVPKREKEDTAQMLRLATVFSGIGAIEQALLRKHIDHEIAFACDNGDQTPFVCGAIEWQECVDIFKKGTIYLTSVDVF